MTHTRGDRTSRERRRAGSTFVLAAATGGLLAAAMVASPTARADDPFTDILYNVQASIIAGEAEFLIASNDFSTAGDTNAGLIGLVGAVDNTFIAPTDYVLTGLTDAATGTDASGLAGAFFLGDSPTAADLTAAGQEAIASSDTTYGDGFLSEVPSALSSGDVADAVLLGAYGSFFADIVAPEADLLAALFSAGI